jgi:hypothetical protein
MSWLGWHKVQEEDDYIMEQNCFGHTRIIQISTGQIIDRIPLGGIISFPPYIANASRKKQTIAKPLKVVPNISRCFKR